MATMVFPSKMPNSPEEYALEAEEASRYRPTKETTKALHAEMRFLIRLNHAIMRSMDMHGVLAPSKKRDDLFAQRDRAVSRAFTRYDREVDAEALLRVKGLDSNYETTPKTPKQWRSRAADVGRTARVWARSRVDRELKKAGLEPPGLLMDFVTAHERYRRQNAR